MSDLFEPVDSTDARLALGATGLLADFNTAGVLTSADVHVARALGRLGRETDDRVLRARLLPPPAGSNGPLVDTEAHLASLVLHSDPGALEDLRRRALRPLDDLSETTRERLEETLRAWLLHRGARAAVAEELFVHPQTVRYRVTQLRDLFGEVLDDPTAVFDILLALGPPPASGS